MKGCLILMPLLFRGGSEKQVRLIIEEINRRRLPLSVVVESRDVSMQEEENKFINENSAVNFVLLNTGFINAKHSGKVKKYITKLKSLRILYQVLKEEIKKNNIRTVMITNLTGLVLVPLFKQLNCYVIYNERNPGVKVCSSLWKREMLNRCEKVIANSKYAAEYMSKSLGHEVEVFNNGVTQMRVVNRAGKAGIFRIIVPARVSPVKNQMVIIKAVKLLKDKLKIEVIFAGVIEDEDYYNDLMLFIKENKIENCFKFIGYTNEIYKYYEKSNLLILSSYEEGTPNVILESFMCCIPVVASNIPMNEYCMQEKTWLFDPNNEKELAEKILMMESFENKKMQGILQKNREYVMKNYAINKMQKRYCRLLYELNE